MSETCGEDLREVSLDAMGRLAHQTGSPVVCQGVALPGRVAVTVVVAAGADARELVRWVEGRFGALRPAPEEKDVR